MRVLNSPTPLGENILIEVGSNNSIINKKTEILPYRCHLGIHREFTPP